MRKNQKNILLIFTASIVLFGFAILFLLKPQKMYSLSERRSLAGMPELSADRLVSGRFMTEFDDYTMDQFPFRESFRRLKASACRYVFGQQDEHGLYVYRGNVSKMEYPMKEEMTDHAAEKLQALYDRYLFGTDCKVYLSVIPDKNQFLAPLGGWLYVDQKAFSGRMQKKLGFAAYIDIFPLLELGDYYKTDQHWRQECIVDVARLLGEKMGAPVADTFVENTLEVPFYGAYAGQSALSLSPDTIRYLTSDILSDCKVTRYEKEASSKGKVYDLEKAQGRDPYDLFLAGAAGLLVLENPNASTDKELVIFGDSFASSLAPLLISGYARITLADLRYMPESLIGDYISFQDQDVLFLYSTLLLNNSMSLR